MKPIHLRSRKPEKLLLRYYQAVALRDALEAQLDHATRVLKKVSGPPGFAGLPSEFVRASVAYQKAKASVDVAFHNLREFNTVFVRQFKKEIAQDRAQRLAQREKEEGS